MSLVNGKFSTDVAKLAIEFCKAQMPALLRDIDQQQAQRMYTSLLPRVKLLLGTKKYISDQIDLCQLAVAEIKLGKQPQLFMAAFMHDLSIACTSDQHHAIWTTLCKKMVTESAKQMKASAEVLMHLMGLKKAK